MLYFLLGCNAVYVKQSLPNAVIVLLSCLQEKLEKRRREKLKKRQKALAEDSEKRVKEFEEKKEEELVNMKADEVGYQRHLIWNIIVFYV